MELVPHAHTELICDNSPLINLGEARRKEGEVSIVSVSPNQGHIKREIVPQNRGLTRLRTASPSTGWAAGAAAGAATTAAFFLGAGSMAQHAGYGVFPFLQ